MLPILFTTVTLNQKQKNSKNNLVHKKEESTETAINESLKKNDYIKVSSQNG